MKRIRWQKSVSLLLGICLTLLLALPAVSAEADSTAPLSHGVQVLAAQTDVALWMPAGNDILFSRETFARGLNLSSVKSITVRSLPKGTDGALMLGGAGVAVGQTVAAANLPYMSFCASSDAVTHASFQFSVNGGSTVYVCNLYLLNEINYTPTVSMAPELALSVSTYQGLCAHGTLSAYDPDGDEIVYEIVSYPAHGSLRLTDRAHGGYVYEPYANYAGTDRFTYVARDRYGNYSASATVSLSVNLPATSVTYADMEDSHAYAAALAMTESGVMSGTQVGSLYYFYPEQSVSRAEFLVMAMNALGMTDVPACADTGFADDAEIPPTMKGYVAAAYSLGYINGSLSAGKLCFLPNEDITRAQAAVMLSAMLGLEEGGTLPTLADDSAIPTWARGSVYALYSVGLFQADGTAFSPNAPLTRAQAAKLLAGAMAYVQ